MTSEYSQLSNRDLKIAVLKEQGFRARQEGNLWGVDVPNSKPSSTPWYSEEQAWDAVLWDDDWFFRWDVEILGVALDLIDELEYRHLHSKDTDGNSWHTVQISNIRDCVARNKEFWRAACEAWLLYKDRTALRA